jgi:hypothetical protein
VSSQAIQVVAGVLVVAAFAGLQLKRLDPYRVPYLVLNLIGTVVLTVVALRSRQFGFVLTNGVWAGVSLLGLMRLLSPGRRDTLTSTRLERPSRKGRP